MTLRQLARHVVNAAAIFAVFVVLVRLAPDGYEKHAEMRCDNSGLPTAVFPDIVKCGAAQVGERRGCSCVRPEAEWTKWYHLGFMPVATAIAAFILLTGPFSVRLIVLNLSVALAIIAYAIYSVTTDPAYAMVMHLVPFEVLAFCGGISILYALMHIARHLLGQGRKHAT